MISGIAFAFVVAPCFGATVMAALLRDWRLIAAAVFGALGILALSEFLPEPVRLISLPPIMGVIIGSVFLLPRMALRPTSDIWSRMLWAIAPTFLVTFLFLLINTSGV